MSYSTIKLYSECEIQEDKNFYVESIEDYLATLSYHSVTKFQYIKHALDLEIKIDDVQNFISGSHNWNYISIQNSNDTAPVYYFVKARRWRGQETVLLELRMDTLNSFRYNSDYTVLDRTKIDRQHLDRFIGSGFNVVIEHRFEIEIDSADGTSKDFYIPELRDKIVYTRTIISTDSTDTPVVALTSTGVVTVKLFGSIGQTKYAVIDFFIHCLLRNIHLKSEGLNPVLTSIEGQKSGIIQQELDQNYYLIYRNNNAIDPSEINPVNPVSCFLCSDIESKVHVNPADTTWHNSDISSGYHIITKPMNEQIIYFKIDNITYNTKGWQEDSRFYQPVYTISKSGANDIQLIINYYSYKISPYGIYDEVFMTIKTITSSEIEFINPPATLYDYESLTVPTSYITTANASHVFGTVSTQILKGIEQIDRTDSQLIKIIQLPYAPTNITLNNGIIETNSFWKYNSTLQLLELIDLNTKFENEFETNVESPLRDLFFDYAAITTNDARNMKAESKLYHSDFWQPKFVYDSFSFNFQLEKVNGLTYLSRYQNSALFNLKQVTSRNINSKFLYQFPEYRLKYSNQDYDNVLPINRNNEITLYSSQYINYLRNSYNYDKKYKERHEFMTAIQTGLGIGSSYYSGKVNPLSLMGQAVDAVNSVIDSEENMAHKMALLQAQATSVMNADDMDLLEAYSSNRAKIKTYQLNPELKNAIYNLFYYCGYKIDIYGTPTIDTRYWFNFVACDLELDNEKGIPEEMINDLKDRFKDGVIFLHKRGTKWLFTLDKENWETRLLS